MAPYRSSTSATPRNHLQFFLDIQVSCPPREWLSYIRYVEGTKMRCDAINHDYGLDMNLTEADMEGNGYHELVVNGKALAVPAARVAIIRDLPSRRRRGIIRESRVRLGELFSFFTDPSALFKGPLAGVKGGLLRSLHLPVMVPAGDGIVEYIDELASLVVVIYDGWWNGVILCSEVGPAPVPLSSYTKAPSGDITGSAEWVDGRGRCLVLDTGKLLRREGFLVVV